MNFVTDLSKAEYEKFSKKSPKSHFLQSYAWGEFARDSKNLKPYYVGLKNDEGKLVAEALLLEKKLPLGYRYFYSPRGFLIDFYDYDLLTEFVINIKKFVKSKKGIFIKIDPDLIWNETDVNGNNVTLDKDTHDVYNHLIKLGFKHLGFTKNFETMQPRYTFRINMHKSYEDIVNNFSKTTKQRIKKAEKVGTTVRIGTESDIEEFYKLMLLTEGRKDFVAHDLKYYQKLYEIYNKDNCMNLFIGEVNLDEIISKLTLEKEDCEKELSILNDNKELSKTQKTRLSEIEKQLENLNLTIEEYSVDRDKYGSKIILNGHMIIEYQDKAWVLYAGNHNILTSTYANYKTYDTHLKYCYDKGIKMYDQFGTIGDLSPNNPRLGLHEFKKKFGGDYVEFIGEFDLINNKFMYFVFTKLVPFYRKTIRYFAKKKIKEK